jgi:hypothetical protein
MSEAFLRLHEHFRFLKETHGVDLTVPHGVEIDGRVYPATHKLITIGHSRNPNHNAKATESRFYIPIENGLKVHASTYMGRSGNLSMQMHVPTIHINESGKKTYRHGPALNLGEDAYYASFGEDKTDEHMGLHSTRGPNSVVHEVLNMWGKEPYQGTYNYEGQQSYQHFKNLRPNVDFEEEHYQDHLELTPDELNEHRQNFKLHPAEHPHNVTVYGVDTDRAFYNYNTKTEQLRPYQDVFGTPFNES